MQARTIPLLFALYGCIPSALDHESAELTGTTIVSLTFDDTLADQYQVGPMLAAHGFVATFYMNSPRFGSSGYLTLAQALDLQGQGNEVGGHTLDHVDLTTLSTADMQHEVCDDRTALIADGFAVTSFAYPFGADNTTVQSVVKNCNYASARDVGGLVTPTSCSGCPYANPIPPTNPYQIRTQSSIKSTTSLTEIETYVTQAESHGGGWVPIIFHHICDGCDTYAISAANLTAFMDWLAARASIGTEVARVDDVMQSRAGNPPPPGDTTAPTISIACNGAPCSTGWYASTVTVSITATDDSSGVAAIRYTTDGSDPSISGVLYTGPFSLSASATVLVSAVDNAGNRASQSVKLSIDTVAPTASVSRPKDGAVVKGATQVWAAVSDNVGVYRVRYYVDGAQIAEQIQTTYKLRWDTTTVARGPHQLAVDATDPAGNTTRSPSITVTVQ